MKERIIATFQILAMLVICIVCIVAIKNVGINTHSDPPDIVYTDTVVMPNFMDTTAEVGLREALEFYDVHHPEIVYAQAVLETGYFKSMGCLDHNNLFGLYNSKAGRYYRFNHWTESVEQYKLWIQRRYKPPEDYYKFLQRINYAGDSLYIHKLKAIVKNEENKRRHTRGDSIS